MVYYILLCFFFLEYIRPGSYMPALNAFHLNSIVPLTALVGSFFTDKVKVSEVLQSVNSRWILFLLGLMVISGLTCDVKVYALNVFENVVGYFFMFFILKKEIHSLDRIKGVLFVLILVHLIVGALTPQLFSGDGERHYIGSGSFLGDGNDFALSVDIAIPFCFFLLIESKTMIRKLFFVGALGVLLFAVISTQSRGALLGLVCMGAYYWIKSDRKVLGLVAALLAVVFVLAVAPPQFFERMESMTATNEEEMEGSALGRILAWKASLRMVADHPLFGVGVGHFPVKYGAEYRPEGYGKMPWQTAHSSYFLILGELGIPGIIFLVSLIAMNLIASERLLRRSGPITNERQKTARDLVIALSASQVSFAVGGAFLSAAYYPHLFLLAALLECGRDIYKKSLLPEGSIGEPADDLSGRYRPVAV